MSRGWSSTGLPEVGDDPELWTAENATTLLGGGELRVAAVRIMLRKSGIEPVGKRRVTAANLAGGRHARVYRAVDVIEVYEAWQREAAASAVDAAASEVGQSCESSSV